MLILVLYAIGVFILFVLLARFAPRPPAHRSFDSKAQAVHRLVGGLLWSAFGMPWRISSPFAVLERYEVGIRIGPNGRWLSWIVPTWDIPWSQIVNAEEYGGGVKIRLEGSSHELRFLAWPTADRHRIADDIADGLRLHGGRFS
jgi:hypothetical protein